MMKTILCGVLAATGTALVCACSGDDKATASADGGADDAPTTSDGALAMDGSAATDGGLRAFTAPGDPGPGGILFAASGEVLALTGYPFPPAKGGDPAFVDGWQVDFTRLLVTIDKITLSGNPDFVPGDQAMTGPLVAEADGPWAVDLAHGDPGYLPGKGGPGEEAAPIAALDNQNKVSGSPAFATDGTRYAFGFDVIAATSETCDGRQTKNVN